MSIISIIITALFTQNFVMVKFLGICPFLGVSKKLDTAVGMGMAVTFVMAIASAITYLVNLILGSSMEYLQTIVFILIIAGLVQFVEMFVKKSMPALYSALGIYLPLITTNCAVLGVALLNVQNKFNFIQSVVFGTFAALGFTMAIIIFAGIRETIDNKDIPESFHGFPIALITAGLMAIAFMGFSGFTV